MRKENPSGTEDQNFEAFLESTFEATPPDEVVNRVTPWRGAINRILAGMALTTVTLNFLNLNYILLTVGLLLSLLGFRALRDANRWFRVCWGLTIVKLALSLPELVWNATIFQAAIRASPLYTIWMAAGIFVTFLLYFCLWRGFLAIQRTVGIPEHAGAIVGLLIWYALMLALALLHAGGWIIFVPMVVFFVLDLRGLYRLSAELEENGYALRPCAVRISGRTLVITILAVLLLGIGSGYLFGQSYSMDWKESGPGDVVEIERIRRDLIALGFPETVLGDLTDEDIAACDGATRVIVDSNDYAINSGVIVTARNGNSTTTTREYPVKELRITGVGVELSGEREQWKLFHHFRWTEKPVFFGTESIELMPAYQIQGWGKTGALSGRALYDLGSATYTAPFFSLGEETYTASVVFFGESTYSRPFAAFSFPRRGENQRGYISYTIQENQDGYIIDSWINYTHQRSWLQYPVKTAMEYRMGGGWNQGSAFKTIQDALQFFPDDEDFRTFSQKNSD